MERFVVVFMGIIAAIAFAAMLGNKTVEFFGPLVGNELAPIVAFILAGFGGAIALGAWPRTLRKWVAASKDKGGFRRAIARAIEESEPTWIAIRGKIQALALVFLWLIGAFMAANIAATFPTYVEKGGGVIIASVLVGWGAMLASLNAYFAASLKTDDDRRKDHRDLKARTRNAILLAEHTARKLKSRAVRVRENIRNREIDYDPEGDEYIAAKNLTYLEIATPPQLDKLWDSLGIISIEMANALRDFTMHLEEFQRLVSDKGHTNPQTEYMIRRDALLNEIEGLIGMADHVVAEAQASL